MGPLASAVLAGCLTVLRWLLLFTAALLLLLVVVQVLRGDEGAEPVANLILAVGFVIMGFLSGWLSGKLAKRMGLP